MEIREPTPAAADRIREVVDSSLTASFRLSPAQIDGLVDDQFADEAVTDKREDEETLLQVAETSSEIEDTTITGFVEGRLKDGWGEVRWLFVDPEHRGKGIGTELYETATETLRDRGAEHICVTVLEANTEGHDFVERLGLEHDGDRRVEIADESVVNYVYTEPDVDATLPDSTGEDAADEEFPETKRVSGQLTTTDDGTTAYIARDEPESGTAAPFFATYEDDTHTEQHGFYCANCGSLEVSMNNMDHLECNDCGNSHAERSEASYDGSYL
ncbi:ribosomal protein S18 acetylase RimI-like enzyme [Natrinema hispanicum]|uniref:Ribosomal protein S18 acetylase RimI-like enzyme n=1 Tax=Natrinema hispanicum TaxID=392421 RepID=A0A482YD84_9EURY|nr:GNAT family N-acetyltransferase [Natrinema hispanicum]RZV11725.1 ribosomal protein S18 acetylase RimI-like enzyme [Natrinema hispanicum]